ncbi:Aste57867_13074 [Aphanomyces stellatus]|uniref:Aste57867_13074 protein n=1 Tax=Aphanomyces stellatus TaxID=120398 RepID=A0A485KXW3_9STRA|nr:hypothetical protein As57867_013026 [Aphanomyces stellatus]VFT89918.1 Aste57867_13074 [Aphanomyces stellatus]
MVYSLMPCHGTNLVCSGAPLVAFVACSSVFGGVALNEEVKESSAEKKKKEKKKTHWRTKQRSEELDLQSVLLRDSLKKYKEDIAAFDSVEARFDTFATAVTKDKDGARLKAMTFTDFLHSLVLPRFRISHPPRTIQYKCDFVGDVDGLISYEECHLLYHLLDIPVEHFDVAFHMFDLDGNGTVDKAEFLEVLSSVLNNIKDKRITTAAESASGKSASNEVQVEASYHLLLHFFGKNGRKKITSKEFIAVIQSLKESLLRAEFDMYAHVDPLKKADDYVTVHDFAVTLISCFDPKHLPTMLDRLTLLRASDECVTWREFLEFHSVIQNHLGDIKLAFELQPTDEITEEDFIKAAYIVSGVRLSAHIVAMAFRVFDIDGNGTLDHEEVLRVLSARNQAAMKKNVKLWPPVKFWTCVTESSSD